MRISAISFLFLCFVNPILGQSEVDDETEVMGDSEWWSRRITKINRNVGRERIGLEDEDKGKDDFGGWPNAPTTRDTRRRPRPFSSILEFGRSRFPLDLSIPPEPSPILLPPFATPFPVYRIKFSEEREDTSARDSNDESSSNKTRKPSTLERIRIYEITTPRNATGNETPMENKANRVDDSTNLFNDDDENRWINGNTNETKTENYQDFERKKTQNDIYFESKNSQDNIRDVNSHNELENETTEYVETSTDRNNLVKTSRGDRKYQNYFLDERTLTRKRTFSEYPRYDWRRRSGRRFRYFRFGDEDSAVGSVPGIPGRDYPIHQEHTHHHLRNRIDRFPCPRTRKSQIYLPDRASRCQIFYVCYGSKTGVPMVCPNGTLFSESLQVCDWWYNVSC